MIRGRFGRYVDRIREKLYDALTEERTPFEVAGSFALGTFITMLPTLGLGLALFVLIDYLSERVSRIALFASVLVFNPAVKWGVYIASFTLGVFFLGPVEGVTMSDVSLSAGPEIVVRLLLGNVLLAIVATAISYVVVYRIAVRYQASPVGETIDKALAEIGEEIVEGSHEEESTEKE